MNLVEIFTSIEGEGIRAGQPCIFVRLAGCNLRCSYCDTAYSYDIASSFTMTPQEIAQKIREIGIKCVTITGGEPLAHRDIDRLIDKIDSDVEINIETNGSLPLRRKLPNLFYTMDYKCYSSGMSDRMLHSNLTDGLSFKDVLKFVVGTEEDLLQAKEILDTYNPMGTIYFSPVWGQMDPKRLVEFIMENSLYNVRVQVQLHKIIWDANKRGV